jgi:hypothetical protein
MAHQIDQRFDRLIGMVTRQLADVATSRSRPPGLPLMSGSKRPFLSRMVSPIVGLVSGHIIH